MYCTYDYVPFLLFVFSNILNFTLDKDLSWHKHKEMQRSYPLSAISNHPHISPLSLTLHYPIHPYPLLSIILFTLIPYSPLSSSPLSLTIHYPLHPYPWLSIILFTLIPYSPLFSSPFFQCYITLFYLNPNRYCFLFNG